MTHLVRGRSGLSLLCVYLVLSSLLSGCNATGNTPARTGGETTEAIRQVAAPSDGSGAVIACVATQQHNDKILSEEIVVLDTRTWRPVWRGGMQELDYSLKDWSSKGRRLLFTAFDTNGPSPLNGGFYLDLEAQQVERALPDKVEAASELLWVPGSSQLVYFGGAPDPVERKEHGGGIYLYSPMAKQPPVRVTTTPEDGRPPLAVRLRSGASAPEVFYTAWREYADADWPNGTGYERAAGVTVPGADTPARLLTQYSKDVKTTALSHDGRLLATVLEARKAPQARVEVTRLADNTCLGSATVGSGMLAVDWSPDDDALLCIGIAGLWVFRLATGQVSDLSALVPEPPGPQVSLVNSATWLSEGQVVVPRGSALWLVDYEAMSSRIAFDLHTLSPPD